MYDKKFNNRIFNILMFIKQIEIQKKKRSVKYTTTNLYSRYYYTNIN